MKQNGISYKIHNTPSSSRGTVLITHGFSEHSGRYDELCLNIANLGFSYLIWDLRGHGDSVGSRGYVKTFDHYLEDFNSMRKLAEQINPEKPMIYFGHSLGGLITLRYVLAVEYPSNEALKMVILSAPFLRVHQPLTRYQRTMVKVANVVHPKMRNPYEDSFVDNLTHDETIKTIRRNDKKCFDFVTVRWFAECEKAQAYCAKNAVNLPVPSHWFVASGDVIAHSETMRTVAKQIPKATIHEYDGFFHEIFLETEREKPFSELREILASVN